MSEDERQSMEEIYQRHAQAVFCYLCSLTHDADIAEELTQETFYQAILHPERFDGSCKIRTWLCAIAKNQLAVYRRKHPQIQDWETADIPETSAMSAESEILDQLARVDLLKKLHDCPEPFREVIYLRIFGNCSFREIGDVMGKTENWARVTYYRGKEKLGKELKNDERRNEQK